MKARSPRHWIKRPLRPSRPPSATPPTRNQPRRGFITAATGLIIGLVAAYVAANTNPDPAVTWAALGFGGALGAAFACRLQA